MSENLHYDFVLPAVDVSESWQIPRDQGMQQVAQHAEEHRPGFLEQACAFVLAYLFAARTHDGRTALTGL